MFVKPAPGRKVRDPITYRHISEAGEEVPESAYWVRRVASGDVLVQIPEQTERS